jgi:predicted ATPase
VAPELVLVSGYSGIGKSSVVNELQPCWYRRAACLLGQVRPVQTRHSLRTLAQAFQSLIRPLLGKSERTSRHGVQRCGDAGSNAG